MCDVSTPISSCVFLLRRMVDVATLPQYPVLGLILSNPRPILRFSVAGRRRMPIDRSREPTPAAIDGPSSTFRKARL
jgi:hypothetical protein